MPGSAEGLRLQERALVTGDYEAESAVLSGERGDLGGRQHAREEIQFIHFAGEEERARTQRGVAGAKAPDAIGRSGQRAGKIRGPQLGTILVKATSRGRIRA